MISGVGSIAIPVDKKVQSTEAVSHRSFIDNKRLYFILKRTIDLIVSLFVIVLVLSWVSIIIAILILIDSRGPVFFIQKRVGKTGKSFYCFKFRTMVLNNEADIKRAEPNDPRITRVGVILRRYNLDELPQFINVLIGEMSIVGPRPHMHADCFAFSQTIPGYKFRTLVKPGITGLAQSKGFHGPVADQYLIKKRFEWDAFYIRNASFELDLRIIQATVMGRINLLLRRF
jgi:putative colanic acid biosynthesis UDP-glucose lipid carrier transferase